MLLRVLWWIVFVFQQPARLSLFFDYKLSLNSKPGRDEMSLRCRRRVIVDDPPAVFRSAQNQSESPVWLIIRSLQMPTSQTHCCIIAQQRDLQI